MDYFFSIILSVIFISIIFVPINNAIDWDFSIQVFLLIFFVFEIFFISYWLIQYLSFKKLSFEEKHKEYLSKNNDDKICLHCNKLVPLTDINLEGICSICGNPLVERVKCVWEEDD